MTLLGQSLQRVLLGAGHVYSVKPAAAEAGHCAEHMSIDAATRASLELLTTQRGTQKGSLLNEIDCCVTSAGSRSL